MSALLASRVQSAYPRSSQRKDASADDNTVQQRPRTSRSAHRTPTDTFEQSPVRPFTSHHRRPKPAVSAGNTRPVSRRLRADEIEDLLRTLDRDETCIVHLDCLADYRTLVETIDLRKTPLDSRVLCALQQRENRIVQSNACRDIRFHSLIDLLEPSYVSGRTEEIELDATEDGSPAEYVP